LSLDHCLLAGCSGSCSKLAAFYLLSCTYPVLIGFFSFLSFLRHLDFFEMLRNEDELEFAKRFELVSVNVTGAEIGT